MKGTVYSAMTADQEARIFFVDATEMVEEMRGIHGTSPVATAALGRVLAASSILGRMSKNEKDRVTLRVKGNGPIGELIAVADAKGNVKVTLSNPQVETTLTEEGKLNVGAAVGEGEMFLIRDYGLKEPYVGRAELISGEIAEDLANLFATSEQQPSIVNLGVHVDGEGKVTAAGGLIVQPLPYASEETIDRLEKDALQMPPISTLMKDHRGMDVIEAAMPHSGLGLVLENEVNLRCDCSRDRMAGALVSLGKEELQKMIDEDQGAEITCHFCHTRYAFDAEELRKLKEEA